jgi:hypothetical protein|tara:strand:- start:367 stop:639 length:273 start_codon:yes stop_codon:yes gene_type:complete
MKDNLSRVELAEMLLQLEEQKENNHKLIQMLEDSLNGMGGTMRENRVIWKQEIAELKEVMREQEEIRKKCLIVYVQETLSMEDVKQQLNK